MKTAFENPRVLWLAVLESAMRDSMLSDRHVRQHARDWLLLDQEDFPLICEMAGLDYVYLRDLMAAKFRRDSGPATTSPGRGHLLRRTPHVTGVMDAAGVHIAQP